MKRILAYILAAALAFSALTVFGDGIDFTVNAVCSKITFDISGESGETASLLVTDGNNKIVYVMSEKLKETGAVFNVVMPDYNNASSDISDTYFYILKKGESKINGEFDYIGSFKRKEYIKNLNAQTDLQKYFADSKTDKMFSAFGIDYGAYSSAENEIKAEICERLLKVLPADENRYDEFSVIFNSVCLPVYINHAKTESEIKTILTVSQGVESGSLESEKEIDYAVSYVFGLIPFETVSEINGALGDAKVSYDIMSANKADMTEMIKKYAENLGISGTDEYSKYISSAAAAKYVNEQIILNKPVYVKDISAAFKKAASEYKESSTLPSAGGGGGGGGSLGGGSGAGGVTVDIIPDTVKEPYSDLESAAWAREYILKLTEKGIVNGDGNGRFNPNDYVTREQLVKMLSAAYLSDVGPESEDFSDAVKTEYYYIHIMKARNAGLVIGRPDGSFGVGEKITRQDAAVMIYRLLAKNGKAAVGANAAFSDFSEVADYAAEAVLCLCEIGIINGFDDGTFKPAAYLTRAEAAKLICGIDI